ERCDREINRVGIFAVLEKQMRAAARGKRTNPVRVRNLARLTLRHDQILARHRSPCHVGRSRASAAIDAMTINQCKWPALQHVSCPTAKASTSEFHIINIPGTLNGTNRMSDIEERAARVAATESGQRQSFKRRN